MKIVKNGEATATLIGGSPDGGSEASGMAGRSQTARLPISESTWHTEHAFKRRKAEMISLPGKSVEGV